MRRCLRRPGIQLTAERHDQLLATVEASLDQLARVTASLLDISQRQAHGVDSGVAEALELGSRLASGAVDAAGNSAPRWPARL
jgi:hypothetical protein